MSEHTDEQRDDLADYGGGTDAEPQTDDGADLPPRVEPITPPDADPATAAVSSLGLDRPTEEPAEASEDAGGTAPTQPGDEGVPFRPSSDFEQAADEHGNLIEHDG